jgi:plasmid stabilization system protein ParE
VPFTILITPSAHRHIVEAVLWWRANRLEAPGLLEEQLDQALLRLAEKPHLGRRPTSQRQDLYRYSLRRVGYYVLYRVRPKLQRIEVVAVWHARRGSDPRSGGH